MLNVPNLISILHIPLALVFLQENPFYRALAILLALASDGLDGYLARRYRLSSSFGTLLDPFTDKFFVFTVCAVFITEHRLSLSEACMLICRDFSVIFFGIYLALSGHLANYPFRSLWCGKITTVFQFTVLFALIFQKDLPFYIYGFFVVLGILALLELYFFPTIKHQGSI
jgi:CDP-diacylglycerol---glycerol-3-phosphate 3-phosphatidyltransferase